MKDKSNTSHVEYRQFIHDLKNSICGIDGIADIGLASDDLEMYRTSMKMVKNASRTLLDLLASEKNKGANISSDAELGNRELFDVKEHIDSAVFPAYSIIREKHLDFELNLEESVPHEVVSFPLAISRILGNLVVNAARYTEKGKISISVSWEAEKEENSGNLLISVKDTGPGMSEDQLSAVFQPFYRGHVNSTEGEGLGLSVSRRLAELMNGTLLLSSSPGQGTNIILSIPCQLVLKSEEVSVDSEIEDNKPKEKLLEDIRVFVVDDNELSRKFLNYYLSREGAVVDTFESGEAVLSVLGIDSVYNLGIIDINLPGKNGFEIAAVIHALYKNIPLVGLTAYSGDYIQESVKSSGMFSCLSKPINSEMLIQQVLEIISGESLLRR